MGKSIFSVIWENRSLIFLLSITDVKLRYRNSFLGFFWTFLEPLLMLTVLYFVFTNIFKTDIENYALFLLLGLILWYMFSRATTMGMTSLTDKSNIIQKIYMRKEIIVFSSALTSFIMMSFEFAAFAVFLVALQFVPPLTIVILPLILIDLFVLSLGFSLMLSVLNIYFKDIRFIWQVILQAGFFLTPILYKLDIFPENIQFILRVNPLVPILESAHDVVLYNLMPSLETTLILIGTSMATLLIGYAIFRLKDHTIIENL